MVNIIKTLVLAGAAAVTASPIDGHVQRDEPTTVETLTVPPPEATGTKPLPEFTCFWGRQYMIWDRYLVTSKNYTLAEGKALGKIINKECGAVTGVSLIADSHTGVGTVQFNLPIGQATCVDAMLTIAAKKHVPCRRRRVKNGELLLDEEN